MKVFLCESIHPKAYEALAQKAEIISDWERAGEVDALLDRILYIGNKGIMEAGSHDELMAKHGLYYHLYTTQAREQGVAV